MFTLLFGPAFILLDLFAIVYWVRWVNKKTKFDAIDCMNQLGSVGLYYDFNTGRWVKRP